MRLFVGWRFLLNTGSSSKYFRNNSHQKLNSWWVLNFINKNERVEVQLHNDIKTEKYRCSSWDQWCMPTVQKTLQEAALFNYKLMGTLPRHDAKAQLIPWPRQHIGTAETSSTYLSIFKLYSNSMYDGSIPIHHIFSPIFLHMAAHLVLFNIYPLYTWKFRSQL